MRSERRAIRIPAFILLWLALLAQIGWVTFMRIDSHVRLAAMWYPLAAVVCCLFVALTNGRIRWAATPLRLWIGFAFLQAVGDRFGLFGKPGAPGVAWGDFNHFIAYTAQVNPFLPHAMIPAIAVLATLAEITFGFTMLFGIGIPDSALGSAILLFLFATAMTVSHLSQFSYGVYLMSAGALSLASIDATFLSIDAVIRHRIALVVPAP